MEKTAPYAFCSAVFDRISKTAFRKAIVSNGIGVCFRALGGSNTERVWTIGRREDDSQRWMLVARPMQTLVLELGTEMVETDRAGFAFGRTTIAAGDLADGSIAVQVD